METNCEYISFDSTGYFSKLMLDYVKGDEKLKAFYNYPVSLEGIQQSIEARKQFDTPRELLVEQLRAQYQQIQLTNKQEENLQNLRSANTFTICTAHQPNIFTGPLYFIYKILHAIRLADELNKKNPDSNFVPVYYMGSEDADLDELGNIHLNGQKLEWQTKQSGAVGRMKVDKDLIRIIDKIAGEIGITTHGKALVEMFRNAYQEGELIQQSTLKLVNEIFRDFGLLVLIPDNGELKKHFEPIVRRELVEQFSHQLVQQTTSELTQHYKAQASGREINLFYLTENSRERIEKNGDRFIVEALKKSWTEVEILSELEQYPERFSANVILRGVFQETILPNIVFIGGGGEIAYWLELKRVFEAAAVPYPMLVVRNSFLLINESQKLLTEKLGFEVTDLFQPKEKLVNTLVVRDSKMQLNLSGEKQELENFYINIRGVVSKIDVTLIQHTHALHKRALEKIEALEKKMLRAEKRKFEAQQRQISKLKDQLFPNNSLQERQENFATFYSKFGHELLTEIYHASLGLEQYFAILEVD